MGQEFDFERFKVDALAALRADKPLTGKDGVLAPLLENHCHTIAPDQHPPVSRLFFHKIQTDTTTG